MRNLYASILALLFTSTCPLISSEQNDPYGQSQSLTGSYQARAAQLRAEVWAWDIPAFSDYSVPEEYAGESAVILARHRQIDATARKGSFWTDPAGKLFYSDIDRYMIKINDQTALNNFSEYSFKEENKSGSLVFGDRNVELTVIGARIIKPDGTIGEVDVSRSAVSMTEGKNDKEAYKKLAIPELQKGDILDVFICEIYELTTSSLSTQFVPFFSIDYPARNYSCQLAFGKNLTIEYRSINGAPVFVKDTDAEKNIVLKAQADKVMRINDGENLRWLSSPRDLSMIRFAVLQNASKALFKPKSARPLGVHENIPYDRIVEDAKWYMAFQNSRLMYIKDTKKKVEGIVANYRTNNPDSATDELADVIYAALNFEWNNNSPYYYNPGTFTLMLDQLLKDNGIESRIGYATSKYDARKDEVVVADDLYSMIAANNGGRLYFLPYRYRVPGEIPPALQGETATVFTLIKISGNAYGPSKIDAGPLELITIPQSRAEDNVNHTRIEASVSSEDNGKLLIRRNSRWTGGLKPEVQSWLLLYENWDTTVRRSLHIDKSFIDELNEKRRTRKLIDNVEGNLEKQREKYAETIKREIVSYHNAEPGEVKEYAFTSFGVTKAQSDLIYDVTYVMDGFVRTAGENLILEIGKLIGIQWNPTDNERARNVDAYIPTARIFENEISFKIPEGYKAGSIENLNVNYSNEYISFESNAAIDEDNIVIRAKKTYHKAFISKDDWDSLINVIDKTNDFYSGSVILRKN